MLAKLIRFYRANPLSLRILMYILCFSTVFAIVTTGADLYVNYRVRIDQLERRLTDVKRTLVPSLRESLWKVDRPGIETTIKALQNLPYINYVRLITSDNQIYQRGVQKKEAQHAEEIAINYALPDNHTINLGKLDLYVDKSEIYDSLLIQLFVILGSQAIKTFSVSVFILAVLHLMLMRHLSTLARFADNLSLKSLGDKLILYRKGKRKNKDELDKVADSMDRMRERLLKDVEYIRVAKKQEKRLISAVEASPAGIIIANKEGRVEYVNESFLKLTGAQQEDIIGQEKLAFGSGHIPAPVQSEYDADKILETVFTKGRWAGEAVATSGAETSYWAYFVISTIHDNRGNITHILLTMENITELKEYEEHLFKQKNYDEATGLPTRQYAFDRLNSILDVAAAQNQNLVFVILSIQNFMNIRETLGASYADALLKYIGIQIRIVLPGSSLNARIGEQELLIVLENVRTSKEAEIQLRKLMVEFVNPIEIDNEIIAVSFHIGASIFPKDGRYIQELHKNALSAMSKARQMHSNLQFYSEDIGNVAQRHLRMATLLRGVTERNEIKLCYQPLIDSKNNCVHGHEALVRWHSSDLGLVPPDQFIGVAEETGDIIKIGNWIMNEAIEETSQWRSDNQELTLSINISPVQLIQADFLQNLIHVLEKTNVDPGILKLEMTEQIFLKDREMIAKRLNYIKKLGVQLVLDDFGTGYSSLSYLQDYPFDCIKIDKSFVMDMHKNERNDMLVHTIIDMAHNMGMKVTAEGVESAEHVPKLKEYNCDLLQGYYFSKPQDAKSVIKSL